MSPSDSTMKDLTDEVLEISSKTIEDFKPELSVEEVGIVTYVGHGIASAIGLPNVRSEEMVRFSRNTYGMVFNLDEDEIGVVLLDPGKNIDSGSEVYRTHRVIDVNVGDALIGRTVDALGRVLDDKGSIESSERASIEQQAPAIMDRDPVEVPLQTGIKAIDALIPIGRGQRELIIGDRQTGKSAIALDTIINQKGKDVICVYCAIGQKSSDTAKFIAQLHEHEAMEYSIIVIADGEDPPGLRYVAPYAATSIAEYYMEQGRDALIVYDDLTKHARSYRELSLLLGRPPSREAYPGDIFYIHSRLLERSTHLTEDKGGGSLTALPIIETQAQNISAYIPTNLISITDGQIYVSPKLFQKGLLPAIDVGKSVSRIGGKTQLPVYRGLGADLRLAYSQFEELESFARFSTRLDEETRRKLQRGRRVREILKQPQYQPISVPEQIAVLTAVNEGLFDDLEIDDIADAEAKIRERIFKDNEELEKQIYSGDKLSDEQQEKMVSAMRDILDIDKDQNGES